MEAAAIEKLKDLITESQTEDEAPEIAPILFPLDLPERTVELEIVDDDFSLTFAHKIKWPTLEKLNEREQRIPRQQVVLGPNRIRSQSADAVGANALLWDKFRSQVKGYGWEEKGINPDQWVTVTPELAEEIPAEHKSEAIVAMFASEFKVERPEGPGFVLGAATHRVRQTYGPYTIYHVIGRHHENDRRQVVGKSEDTQVQTGTTKPKSTTFTNLTPYCQFYDKFFVRLEGVTGDDPNIAQRKDLVSALWKRGVVDAVIDYFEAPRGDSKRN
jgi:hypothetical protein